MKKHTNFDLNKSFHEASIKAADWLGSSSAFILATLMIMIWAITGPLVKFSDTWQLIINTSTTIATFLMLFLIQNTQNRDTRALHLKLDELIRAVAGARNELVNLESLGDEELDALKREFKKLQAYRANKSAPLPQLDVNA